MEKKQNIEKKRLDIKSVIRDKSPKLAKWIPGFAISYLRKITHEDLINYLIDTFGHLKGYDFSKALIENFNITIETEGVQNLPNDGRYVFVSNHPLGGFDGHIIMYLVGKHFPNYKFLVNDILMNLKNMHGVFIPVNKHGKQGIEYARKIDNAYKSDDQILTFPAGLVSRKIKGQVMDLIWQKNFITKAKQHKRDIIPIHMSGGNTKFFYRLSNIRKMLGIKANIEMLYLIDETVKHQNKKFIVKFGKPISWETFDSSKRPAEWAKFVKQEVYKMDGVNTVPF